jgi:hypothetical protein
VPTSFTLLPNTTDITTLEGWFGISVQLGGRFIGPFQDGVLRPSANTGFWYAFTVSGSFSQAVLLQFLIQPEGVNVQAVGARFLFTTIQMSDDAAFNDAFWATMTATLVATTPSENGYGVPSFSFTVPFILNAFPLSDPAPPPSTQWEFATNRDGLLTTNDGIMDITILGTNDNNGMDFNDPSGYAVVYAYFQQPTLIFLDWQFTSNDGINYDWPIINESFGETFPLPPNNDKQPFNVIDINTSGQIGFQTSGNSWFYVGVYSADSSAGAGTLTLQGLPT